MLIKDWWYAIKVCRKYGIKLRFQLTKRNYAYAAFNPDTGLRKITIHPLDHTFKQTFLHEVSHLLSFTRKSRNGVNLNNWLSDLNNKMREETQAWVFGKRVMKGKFAKSVAIECLQSYSAYHYSCSKRHINTSGYTDNLVNCFKRIEK